MSYHRHEGSGEVHKDDDLDCLAPGAKSRVHVLTPGELEELEDANTEAQDHRAAGMARIRALNDELAQRVAEGGDEL